SGQLDVSTQCFKQDASVKTSVTSLRFIAAQCEMRGELTVNRDWCASNVPLCLTNWVSALH
ncbi:hypothetical protein, partial [Legionella sp. 29fVS95]|uniref:hypothetical protein n=1 Tax=Legionella sp. 29fVS95 TaxID=3402813 RepID=UPI003AF47B30